MFKQIAIYGVGLMGASIGLAARERKLAERVVGLGRNEAKLKRARELGCVDDWTTEPGEYLAASDLVILCTPVAHILKTLPGIAASCADGAIVSDVGSTKASLVAEALKYFENSRGVFIGSHPVAGSEKTGAENACADLFEGACCFVTPTREQEKLKEVGRVEKFWQAIGSRVVLSTPEKHDYLMATVSHAPHLMAVALIESIRNLPDDPDLIREVSGTGLRDTTRVAAGSPEVWRDICRENKEEIVKSLERVMMETSRLRKAIEEGNEVEVLEILEKAAEYRSAL